MSKVVYKFCCLRDVNITYIGETTRPLDLRVKEHLSKKGNKTAIGKHISNCNICSSAVFSLHDFNVIKRCRTSGETRIHEALLIRKETPQINKQQHLAGASFVLTVY